MIFYICKFFWKRCKIRRFFSQTFLFFVLNLNVEIMHSSNFFVLTIINTKIVSWQLLSLSYLTRRKFRNFHEFLQIIMIRENENFILNVLQIMSSIFEYFDYNQQFLIVYFVIALNWIHLEEIINNKMSFVVNELN